MVTTKTARSLLTAAQQKMLRQDFGNQNLIAMLIDPDSKTLPGWPWVGGSANRPHDLPDCNYDSNGLWRGTWTGWDKAAERVTWRQVRSYAKSLPKHLTARLATNRAVLATFEAQIKTYRRDDPMLLAAFEQMGALLDEALPLADGLCRCPKMKLAHYPVAGMCDLEEAV